MAAEAVREGQEEGITLTLANQRNVGEEEDSSQHTTTTPSPQTDYDSMGKHCVLCQNHVLLCEVYF